MRVLGISAFYHDSAAALVVDGEVVAAAQEERFTRKKFDATFPQHSIIFCLNKAGLKLSDLDEIVYYEKPFLSFERLIESIITTAPHSLFTFLSSMPVWMREKLNTRATLKKKFSRLFPDTRIPPLCFSQHHLSHAASAFFPSPFESAAILCLDGVGEWATTTAWVGQGGKIKSLWEIRFPHSLGLLYSAFTHYCGFRVNSGEYKLMGLAPLGQPIYVETIKQHLIDIKQDGSFRLNMKYFPFAAQLRMTNSAFHRLFGAPPRPPEAALTQLYKDLAASIQKVTEEVILRLARSLRAQTGERNLCLAGGVAMNCVANGLIAREQIFANIWIQPAAGDAGAALGAALASYYLQHNQRRLVNLRDSMHGALLGPQYGDGEIEELLISHHIQFLKVSRKNLIELTVADLKQQKVVGWFQNAMEFGARALGNRSILGDPRSPEMQRQMNLKIKFRESFRPFAPAVLSHEAAEIFTDPCTNPYMTLVTQVKEKFGADFPAITHVDGSARIQAVNEENNKLFFDLITQFERETGCPMLVNTSFNVRGEPIVCTPLDALRCFVNTDIETLAIGSYYVSKAGQNFDRNEPKWRTRLELD